MLLHLLLGILDRPVEGTMLEHIVIPEGFFQHLGQGPLIGKQPHQIIFQRNIEPRPTGISLTGTTSTQLTVDSTGLMSLSSQNQKPTELFHTFTQFNIRTTTCHIGSDGHRTLLSGLCNDFRFPLVKFCIQYSVANIGTLQHATKYF